MAGSVVVTGAAGFIGRWVVAELLERGHEVRGLDDLSSGSRENVAKFEDHDRFSLTVGDVRARSTLAEVFDDDVEGCIHLAAEIDVHESLEDPGSHFETNVVGSYHVLEACRRSDTGLTMVGTCMVYDMVDVADGIDETHAVKPASPYAGTKLAAENLAESYYRGYGLPVTILRPFNTYGPFQRSSMAGGVISIFASRDLAGESLTIYGDGTQTRDFLYVTDCARFVVDGALSDAANGEVINAGFGQDISINDLAQLVASGGTPVEHVEHHHPQSEIPRLLCDASKAKRLLGWEPRVSLEEGVDRLRRWIAEGSSG